MVVMDATFKTNVEGYVLVNLCSTSVANSGVPVAHMLVSVEHSSLLEFGLRQLYKWTDSKWSPFAFLIDGDNREAVAIRNAFPDAFRLRCTRHSRQTLIRRLGNSPDGLFYMT